jgi:hypothetical protein
VTALTVVDFCDAIAEDLALIAAGIAGLYLDWRYAPLAVGLSASNAPWLAVYAPSSTHTLVDTTDFMDDDNVEVQWAVSVAGDVEDGSGTPALVRAAIVAAVPLREQLKTYAQGLPGLGNQVLGTLLSSARSTSEGMVFAQTWRLTVNSTGVE